MNSNSLTTKKIILNGTAFVAVIALTFYVVFRHISLNELVSAISMVRFRYILAGLMAMFVFCLGEGLNIRRPLNMFGDEVTVPMAIKYAVVGFFFSSVTPSSSGGQPLQLYVMHSDGIMVSHGTLALLFELMSFEIVATVFATTGYMTQHDLLVRSMGKGRFFLIIGIVVSVLIIAFILMAIFTKKAISTVCKAGVAVVRAFSKKKADLLAVKAELMVEEYHSSAIYFKSNKGIFIKSLFTALIQMTAMFSVPYFVYLGFGLSGFSAFQIISLQAVLFVAVAFLPLPGAVGASEGAFVIMFKLMFPKKILAGAMVLSRCLSFYICVIITGIAVSIFLYRIMNKSKWEK